MREPGRSAGPSRYASLCFPFIVRLKPELHCLELFRRLLGLFPALQLARPEISQRIQASSRKVVGTIRGKRFHKALIAGQIALTLLLMAAAGAGRSDPLLILSASVVLLAAAAVACTVPSWRASSVYPMTALRCEITITC